VNNHPYYSTNPIVTRFCLAVWLRLVERRKRTLQPRDGGTREGSFSAPQVGRNHGEDATAEFQNAWHLLRALFARRRRQVAKHDRG